MRNPPRVIPAQALKQAVKKGGKPLEPGYNQKAPLSSTGLKTVPIDARGGKVQIEHFARPYRKGEGLNGLLASLPKLLAADSFQGVIEALRRAKREKKAILWGMGGHVVKCGLGDILLDLMRQGWVSGFVMNGAASIHDFEIAIAGQTSEDVEAVLPDGRFGAAEETGREMNLAIAEGLREGLGMGEALGRRLETIAKPAFVPHSIVAAAYQARVPVTVHVAWEPIRRTRIPEPTGQLSARDASRFPPALFAGARP